MSGIPLAVVVLAFVLLFFFVRFVQLAWFFVVGIVMILTVKPVVFKLIGAGFLAASIAETYQTMVRRGNVWVVFGVFEASATA